MSDDEKDMTYAQRLGWDRPSPVSETKTQEQKRVNEIIAQIEQALEQNIGRGGFGVHVSEIGVRELLNSHATLTRERDSLREALEKYGDHTSGCDVHFQKPCDCGLSQILSATEGRKS